MNISFLRLVHSSRALFAARFLICFATLGLLCLAVSSAQAQIAYSETASGDLSNSGLTPTAITVHAGTNLVFGTTGRGAAVDRDYFTLTVPVGLVLDSIVEQPGTEAGGVSFFGVQAGPQLTLPTNAVVANGLLGWAHYGETSVATDLFPILQVPSNGSSGFTGSLGAGTYSFWVQDFTPGTYSYGFDLHLAAASPSPVPEPSTYALAGSALLALLALRRRFVKSAPVSSPRS